MLILTRRTQESIMIGENVTITVLSVKGNQVRLGIEAPKNVEVHREEIYQRIKAGVPIVVKNDDEEEAEELQPRKLLKVNAPKTEPANGYVPLSSHK